MGDAVFYTVSELWERGRENVPAEFVSASHLIYSSPATLSFNSPGAEGFGVKRAGLSVPGSVMLIVSPGCCGRNTSSISSMPGYENRFFYLTMNETDLITGSHLTRIPKAVCSMIRSLERMPSVVMICITCVDALLGTDMERVCRIAEKVLHEEIPAAQKVQVKPCYMYALTREGRKPPMVHVRQSIYSLLKPVKKRPSSVNILGYFAPVAPECELFTLLSKAGVRRIRQISTCPDFAEFEKMAEANFNLVLNPETRPAAADLEKRLGIPSIELTRLYRTDRIAAQYDALGSVLGTEFDYKDAMEAAETSIAAFRKEYPGAVFSVGEALNADPFEMALSLVSCGFKVREIFGTVTPDTFRYLRRLAELSPDTRVYSNLSPSMMHYSDEDLQQDRQNTDAAGACRIALGRDAGWYHPGMPCLSWADDVQPFGFAAVRSLFDSLLATMQEGRSDLHNEGVRLGQAAEPAGKIVSSSSNAAESGASEDASAAAAAQHIDASGGPAAGAEEKTGGKAAKKAAKGYRGVLTPFAPDQSGAVSVLYALGGMTVICDAGGCTGNICGFDEPRWFSQQSAVFSAGLRDMDAILGRDRDLVQKVADAAETLDVNMTAIVGTPVPAVIGTDFRALPRMAEKQTGLPSIGIACDGMHHYDTGIEKTYIALLERFCRDDRETGQERGHKTVAVWGWNPMDAHGIYTPEALREALGSEETVICGDARDGLRAFEEAGAADETLVVSVSGLSAAAWLRDRFGIPFRAGNPAAEETARRMLSAHCADTTDHGVKGLRVLVVHEQITANAVRNVLRSAGAAKVDIATFFDLHKELAEPGDAAMREESDFEALVLRGGYDLIWADAVLRSLLPEGYRDRIVELPHFAVSGKL